EFKRNLVAAFYSQREELAHKTIALANIKPVNKSLSEVVHDSWPDNPHMYATIHNLALEVATGKNAKQLILNGYSYQEIKATVLKGRGVVNA
ncbi:MAG: hypothetical protein E7E62_03575, partial [Weissella confusa]|nr:hypothetical protein [Weissella confusa]